MSTDSGGPHAASSICGTPPAYDANGNTLSHDADGAAGLDQIYTRNAVGQITGLNDETTAGATLRDWSYGYDTLGRLTAASNMGTAANSRTWRYDAADNMVYNAGLCPALGTGDNITYGTASIVGRSAVSGPGGPHAAASICGGAALQYDKNGNALSYDPDGTAGPLVILPF